MLLVIDIGNTNIEFGVFSGMERKANFRLRTDRNITSDEIGLHCMQFLSFQGMNPADFEDVVITSVVPQIMYSMTSAIRKYLRKEPLVAGENLPIPIRNLYDNPKEVGADRLVDSYAAYKKYGGPLIVVDFGTATTFDVVDQTGAYLGGSIYPGLKISLEALFNAAAKLPRIEIAVPRKVIGKDTSSSMQAGIVYGYAGVVQNLIRQTERELGSSALVVATGGLSGLISEISGMFDHVDKSLTLEGLVMLYQDYLEDCRKQEDGK